MNEQNTQGPAIEGGDGGVRKEYRAEFGVEPPPAVVQG